MRRTLLSFMKSRYRFSKTADYLYNPYLLELLLNFLISPEQTFPMKLIIRILLSALAVLLLAHFLPHVSVSSFGTAIIVAIVLSLLNFIVKPILVILTLPVTIVTFGLFLLIINALIILLADNLIDGFNVDGLWWALLFSLLLSFLQSILFSLLKEDTN